MDRAARRWGGEVFGAVMGAVQAPPVEVKALHAKIGELTLENVFLEGALSRAAIAERQAMINRDHALCVTKQADIGGIARRTVYYLLRPASAEDLALMKQIGALPNGAPFRWVADVARSFGCQCKTTSPSSATLTYALPSSRVVTLATPAALARATLALEAGGPLEIETAPYMCYLPK